MSSIIENKIIRGIGAVIFGLLIGSIVNMALITIGPMLIPLPEGIDPNDMESFKANAHLLEPQHMIFPLLAHVLQALIGAFIATKIAKGNRLVPAMIVGVLSLAGGVAAAFMIPAPTWFVVIDWIAYLPAAYLGWKLAGGNPSEQTGQSQI